MNGIEIYLGGERFTLVPQGAVIVSHLARSLSFDWDEDDVIDVVILPYCDQTWDMYVWNEKLHMHFLRGPVTSPQATNFAVFAGLLPDSSEGPMPPELDANGSGASSTL